MSYLTHSKFPTMMIPDILPLFRSRFRIFWWTLQFRILFRPRFKVIENFDVPFLFRTRFWIFDELATWILFRSRFKVIENFDVPFLFRTRFRIFWQDDTLTFFRTRFIVPDKTILLSSFARGSKLIFKRWFAHFTGLTLDCQTCFVSVLHLKASQTWLCFDLTLEI